MPGNWWIRPTPAGQRHIGICRKAVGRHRRV